jgi:hypothetical protein
MRSDILIVVHPVVLDKGIEDEEAERNRREAFMERRGWEPHYLHFKLHNKQRVRCQRLDRVISHVCHGARVDDINAHNSR